jgi:hypothetical protein
MAMYYCEDCDSYIDDDWHPCVPVDDDCTQLICPSCAEEREAAKHEALEGNDGDA